IGAEIADAGMDMQLAVRLQHDETVEAARARRMERLPDADADDFRAVTLPAARALLLPAELARTHLERLAKMRAGHAALPGTETRRAVRRVDAPDLEPVDAELARGLVDQRLDGRRDLVLARAALRTARRRVRQHRHAAEAHRGRRIDE